MTMPPADCSDLRFRADERGEIITYGKALAAKDAALEAVQTWKALYNRCRERMEWMHPCDGTHLHEKLMAARHDAEAAFDAADAALRALPCPFSGIAEAISRAV